MLSIQYRMLLSVSLYFLANEFIEIALLFICIKYLNLFYLTHKLNYIDKLLLINSYK